MARGEMHFEDALTETGFGKFNIMMFLLSSMNILVMGFEAYSVSFILPASACELKTTAAQQGIIGGMPLTGILSSSMVYGYLADTRGRRKILIASLILGFINSFCGSFSPNWIVFAVFKFMSSCSLGGTYALTLALMSELTPIKKRFTMVLLCNTIFLLSNGVLACIAMIVLPFTFKYHVPYLNIEFNSWRLLNIVYSLFLLLAVTGYTFTYESPKYWMTIDETKEALAILTKIYVMNTGKKPEDFPVKSITLEDHHGFHRAKGFCKSIASQTAPLIKQPVLKDIFLFTSLLIVVYVGVNPVQTWFPTVINKFVISIKKGETGLTLCEMFRSPKVEQRKIDYDDCSLNQSGMVIIIGVNLILGTLNVILSFTSKYIGRKRLLCLIQLIPGIAGICAGLSNIWMLTIGLMVMFASAILNFGLTLSVIVDVFPTHIKAMAACVILMIGRGSSIFGINMFRLLLEYKCEAVFYVFGIITLCGAFIALLLPSDEEIARRKENQPPPPPLTDSDIQINTLRRQSKGSGILTSQLKFSPMIKEAARTGSIFK